jgi:hypothetical protein
MINSKEVLFRMTLENANKDKSEGTTFPIKEYAPRRKPKQWTGEQVYRFLNYMSLSVGWAGRMLNDICSNEDPEMIFEDIAEGVYSEGDLIEKLGV